MGSLMVRTVGVSFVDPDGAKRHRIVVAAEERGLLVVEDTHHRPSVEGLPVVLIRNPDNAYDSNAVEVHVPLVGDDGMIGHLPAQTAALIAPRLDAGEHLLAEVAFVAIHPDHRQNPGIEVRISWSADHVHSWRVEQAGPVGEDMETRCEECGVLQWEGL